MSWKDIVIGILVAYVAIDFMFGHLNEPAYKTACAKLMDNINSKNGLIIAIVGILIGVAFWYLSTKSQMERYTHLKDEEDE